jgi:alcohol dehydrogenase YqhD (iron-dependent ADH family)
MKTEKAIGLLFGLLLIPISASAQFGGGTVITAPGSVTSDAPVEQNTAGILQTDGQILTQDTLTATSVTTGGGGGFYTPNASFISSLDQGLFSGVNGQNFNTWFPGWQVLPPNSTDTVLIPMTTTTLTTYGNALALAQSQEQELAGEDFSNIEADSAGATAVLQAIQANTEAVLADVQEQQYTRQLLAAILTVESTKAGEELNERAQGEATTATSFNGGIAP